MAHGLETDRWGCFKTRLTMTGCRWDSGQYLPAHEGAESSVRTWLVGSIIGLDMLSSLSTSQSSNNSIWSYHAYHLKYLSSLSASILMHDGCYAAIDIASNKRKFCGISSPNTIAIKTDPLSEPNISTSNRQSQRNKLSLLSCHCKSYRFRKILA